MRTTTDKPLGPNAGLIGEPDSLEGLATPSLILRLDVLERNLARMVSFLRESGLKIRPHAKTHKSSTIARRQIEAGALGVCVATLHEAEAMVQGGVMGALITSPVVGAAKIERLVRLNRMADGLMVVVDHPANVVALATAARDTGVPLTTLVDVDIGMHRTGVASVKSAVSLARLIASTDGLEYRGVQGYSGRVQHIEAYAERDATYSKQLEHLSAAVAALKEAGLAPAIVTGGGTGTLGIDLEWRIINEHQAGSYVFMDVEYNAVEIVKGENTVPFETALTMRNTVVSTNAKGFVTIDGGFKCFATDGPLPRLHSGAPAGSTYEFYGDEHGRIVCGGENETLALGATVELVTPHCDPTVNLHDYYHLVQDGILVDIWPIDGRGVL